MTSMPDLRRITRALLSASDKSGLVEFARARNEKSMAERLANEILDASKQQGNAWKRKDDIYRMAQANKAFAHYRW